MEEYRWQEHLYAIFVPMLIVVGIAFYLNQAYEWKLSYMLLYVGIVGTIVVVHVCFVIRKQPVVSAIMIGVLVIGTIILWYHREWFTKSSGQELIRSIFLLALCIIVYLASRISLLRMSMAVVLFVAMVIIGSEEQQIIKFGVSSIICYIFLVFMELCIPSTIKRDEKKQKIVITTLLPVYVIVFVVLLVVPTSKECFQWSMAKTVVGKVNQAAVAISDYVKTKRNSNYGEFQLGITGYSESGAVGGSVWDSDKEALSLSSNVLKRRMLYLKGNRKDTYEGNEWKDSLQEGSYPLGIKEDSMDTIELLYALYRYNGFADIESYLHRSTLHIEYTGVRTKSVFTLGKLSNSSFGQRAVSREKSMIRNKFSDVAGSETAYDLEYYDMNLDSDRFRTFIEQEEGYPYNKDGESKEEVFQSILRRNTQLSYIAYPDKLVWSLARRREYIYRNYTKIDEAEKAPISKLTKTVTEGKKGSYQKLLAIQEYLHNFTYTKTPRQRNGNTDVVLQFLYDTHEGYCTYFASAMALMGRSIGIPTRYVQGYLISADEKGWFHRTVQEKDAHAWVEAYIDGIGWMPFEPTSGYGEGSNASFEPPKVDLSLNSTIEMPKQIKGDINEIKDGTESKWKQEGILIAALVLSLLGLFLLGLMLHILRNKRRYRKFSTKDQFLGEIWRMRQLCHYLHYERMEYETWKEFLRRISVQEREELPLLEGVEECYSRVRYHNEEVTEQELAMMKEHNEIMKILVKGRVKRRTYYMICLRLDLMVIRNTTVKMSKTIDI